MFDEKLWWCFADKLCHCVNQLQKCVKQGIEAAEKAIIMVNQLQLFSDNEELEEVSTSEIK